MKKFIAVSAIALSSVAAQVAMANPGCGLGATIFEGKTGTVNHVLAATTNGTFGNQTFGMTFGTSGCDTSKSITLAAQFINNNMDRVAVDIAVGQGESLDALMALLKIEAAEQDYFKQLVKENFASIYSSSEVTADEVYGAIVKVMSEDAVLAKYAV